jgi:hypothetical protein
MRRVRRAKSALNGWLVALFLAFSTFTNAFGTEPFYEPRAFILPLDEPAKIGETMFVPVEISYSPKWKSAKIRFKPGSQWIPNVGVDPNSVKVGEITLDDTVQASYTVYLLVV